MVVERGLRSLRLRPLAKLGVGGGRPNGGDRRGPSRRWGNRALGQRGFYLENGDFTGNGANGHFDLFGEGGGGGEAVGNWP